MYTFGSFFFTFCKNFLPNLTWFYNRILPRYWSELWRDLKRLFSTYFLWVALLNSFGSQPSDGFQGVVERGKFACFCPSALISCVLNFEDQDHVTWQDISDCSHYVYHVHLSTSCVPVTMQVYRSQGYVKCAWKQLAQLPYAPAQRSC